MRRRRKTIKRNNHNDKNKKKEQRRTTKGEHNTVGNHNLVPTMEVKRNIPEARKGPYPVGIGDHNPDRARKTLMEQQCLCATGRATAWAFRSIYPLQHARPCTVHPHNLSAEEGGRGEVG